MNGRIEIHPRLTEEAVWTALSHLPEARTRTYHRQREPLYRLEDPDERDARFAHLHSSWFLKLELDGPIRQAIAEQREMLAPVHRFHFAPAAAATKQGAELYVNSARVPSVVMAILPRVLIDGERALAILRRELMHIADILDPAFEYEPRLPPQPAGPTHDQLLLDRYRTLWECSIDGRLLQQGRVPATVRERRRQAFMRAFPGLGPVADESFARIFDAPRPSHGSILAMASEPESTFGPAGGSIPRAHRCSLCAFPTSDFEPTPETLPRSVLEAIRSEFPGWRADEGLCRQCADLYRARGPLDGTADRPAARSGRTA